MIPKKVASQILDFGLAAEAGDFWHKWEACRKRGRLVVTETIHTTCHEEAARRAANGWQVTWGRHWVGDCAIPHPIATCTRQVAPEEAPAKGWTLYLP